MHGLLCLHVSDCCSCESPSLLQCEMLMSSQRVYMNVLTLEELLQLIRRGEGGALVEVFLSVASSIPATGASPLSPGVDHCTALIRPWRYVHPLWKDWNPHQKYQKYL